MDCKEFKMPLLEKTSIWIAWLVVLGIIIVALTSGCQATFKVGKIEERDFYGEDSNDYEVGYQSKNPRKQKK